AAALQAPTEHLLHSSLIGASVYRQSMLRLALWALGIALLLQPVPATPGRLTALGAALPTHAITPPADSPDCRSRSPSGEKFRTPLRFLARAMHSKAHIRILAIGSSSTVGLGASSPSATYVARLEPTLEGAFKGIDFDVMGRGVSGEEAQGAADRMRK